MRTLYKTVVIKEEGLRLDYFILSEMHTEEEVTLPTYGVEIIQSPISTFCIDGYRSSSVEDITCDRKKITEFTGELAACAVDPIILFDVVNDRMEEGYFI